MWFGVTIATTSMPSLRLLRPGHLLEIAVGAIAGNADFERRVDRALALRGQRTGNDLVVVVDARGDAMDAADEGALSAADHAQPNPPAAFRVAASLDHLTDSFFF
jgi:hypothetical protein